MYQLQNIILQINTHHDNAMQYAENAIESARSAGELLLHVKSTLPRGEFTPWVIKHLKIGERQCQRYMRKAREQLDPVKKLPPKPDMMSGNSSGIWQKGKWQPEPGYQYLFNEDGAVYWVLPSTNSSYWFHVCKHYHGVKMSTNGFFERYTIFATVHDQDLTSKFYVGTRYPLGWIGVESVLRSYGLKEIEASLISGRAVDGGYDGPFGEPEPEHWYWGDQLTYIK